MNTPYISALLCILFLTSFAKIATAFSVFKEGLGIKGFGISAALGALALALSLAAIEPQLKDVGGIDALLSGKSVAELENIMRPHLEAQSDTDVKNKIFPPAQGGAFVAGQGSGQPGLSMPRLVVVFLVSELGKAFKIGLALLLPFVLIDILVANVLAILTVTQIKAQVVSLPLKLILFVAVDGWGLIAKNLLHNSGGL